MLLLIACAVTGPATTALAQGTPAASPPAQVPSIPDPAPVSLDGPTTAFLALDFNSSVCANLPTCLATLPAVSSGIGSARAAGALVVYSTGGTATVLPDVQMQPSDPLVASGADKFYNTNLDEVLKQAGVKTVVVTGTITNGAVLYTSFGAAIRGYTVVVAADGVSARNDFGNYGTLWQLLNGPSTSNPQNMPLQAKAVTLSRTDLISYGAASGPVNGAQQ
jgi:hypothetical protein